ncbi:MAG TPA: MFS transporter [Frankiaceae bacterium]|nr:MFS transporter [Frankiaceae bacterium]
MPREVPVLAGVAFAVAIGFGIVAPVIPVFARNFGASRAAAAAVVSVFAFMRLVSALAAGRIVDRVGERRILAIGIAVVAVSSALAGLANSYHQLLVLRGIGGIGSAMFTVSAYSLLLRSAPTEKRGQATGLFTGGFLVGGITGPALGGLISEISLRAPFFIYAGTLVVAGGIGLFLLPGAGTSEAVKTGGSSASLSAAARSPAYRAALAAQFADSWSVLGVRAALVPLFVTDATMNGGLGLSRSWVGIGFGLVAALNALVLLPAGRFADRVGRRPVLLLGTLSSTVGMSVLAAANGLALYLVALVILGLGSGLLHVAPGAIVGDTVTSLPAAASVPVLDESAPEGPMPAPPQTADEPAPPKPGRGGTVVAAFQMTGDLGSVLGPLVAGRLADSSGYGAAFGMTAAVIGLAFVMALFASETRRTADETARDG